MERVYELDVYKLAEALSAMVWHDTVQKHEGQISNFYFLISAFCERLRKNISDDQRRSVAE